MADNPDSANVQSTSPKLYFIKETRVAKSTIQQLTGSHDLMTTFNLLPLYNRYVKQKNENNEDLPPIEPTYFPFISDLPGKNVIRPGNYIRALLEAPEKSYGPIHTFSSSTLRDGFSLRPGPVPGFDPSVLGTEEDYKHIAKVPAGRGEPFKPASNIDTTSGHAMTGYADPNSVHGSPAHPAHSHHHHHHSHGHHGSKSSTSSPHVDRLERGEEGGREHKHKKKKKKRKHEHDHEHTHHEGEGDSEHRKKKKRKKEREEHGDYGDHSAINIV
ncbi:hypothetical protein BX616_007892 [Lobosporangium transversale]|uniref:Mediator of RNA polymerase II transcription subunit 19 n=1 Tax=Lobosporangium transversale TaxID=64571 RepID=A0A1Y2GVL1_9FUNG|nr:hypothetical protein BCR41DRAFT_393503 [Lobosporangium transversale]KAF9914633.1 hypothetical protein BX616_007892 [Lobosporangium transversale]ORZ26309.1 hypothetical protein BCR41DRAFT_393503 [Lobosporangium transversale]|eukprot:XP_021884074.1 hypothetical protein BCR41DRAFT_393503 [Lobosporangium transversale]